MSEMAPALVLFNILRQYTHATLEAATSAAYWTAVLKSNLPPDSDGPAQIDGGDFQVFELERNAVMNLPEGWDVGQMKPEHPTQTYSDFKREVVNEIARAMSVPYNLAAGNSSEYNFASGRLDWQMFFKSVDVMREYYERVVLYPMLQEWLDSAFVSGTIPTNVGTLDSRNFSWIWPGFSQFLDPKDEADAAVALKAAGLLDEDSFWAQQGRRTDNVLVRMAQINRQRESLDLPPMGTDNGNESQETGSTQSQGAASGSQAD